MLSMNMCMIIKSILSFHSQISSLKMERREGGRYRVDLSAAISTLLLVGTSYDRPPDHVLFVQVSTLLLFETVIYDHGRSRNFNILNMPLHTDVSITDNLDRDHPFTICGRQSDLASRNWLRVGL